MADTSAEKTGEKTSLFCSVCDEERTFVWGTWSGIEYYGYPPKQEYGWQCAVCGSKVSVP